MISSKKNWMISPKCNMIYQNNDDDDDNEADESGCWGSFPNTEQDGKWAKLVHRAGFADNIALLSISGPLARMPLIN